MKKSQITRLLAVLLVAALCLSLIPALVLAAGETTATLVTDANSLNVGDKIVIVNADEQALSIQQETKYRAGTAITKTGNTVTLTDSVQIITLESGVSEKTFAFKVGDNQYLAAGSTKNTLVTGSKDANASWTINIAGDGNATIKATGSVTTNWLRYNSSAPRFACYASGQDNVYIYKLDASSTTPSDETKEPTDPDPVIPEEKLLTSNATITAGEKFYNDKKIIVDGESYDTFKLGTSKAGGDMTITIPKGATGIQFYVGAWKDNPTTVEITYGTKNETINVTDNAAFAGNGDYTFTDKVDDYFHSINFDAPLDAALEMKVSTPERVVFFGVNVLGVENPNPDTPDPETPEVVEIVDALGKKEGTKISGAVTGYVTLVDGYTVYIQDENAQHGIAIYIKQDTITKPDLKVGQKVTITNTERADFNDLPELNTTTDSVLTVGEETTLKYNEVTSIQEITDAMICTAIKYTGKLTVEKNGTNWGTEEKPYSTPNLKVNDGTDSILIYKAYGDLTQFQDYEGYTAESFTGAVGKNKGSLQLRNDADHKIVLAAPATPPTTDPVTPPATDPVTPPADGKTAGLAFSVKEGDKVYIYYAGEKVVLSATSDDRNRLTGVAGTVTDGKLAVTDGMLELIVSVNDKGQYTFKTADGKFLTSGETGNSLTLADAASDYSLWTLEPSGSSVKIKNVAAKYVAGETEKPQYLEYFYAFTTYSYNSEKDDIYNFQLYVLNAEAEKPVTPSTGDNSMAIVGAVLMVLAVSGVVVLVVGRKKWMR